MAKPLITGIDIGSGTIKIISALKKDREEGLEILSKVQDVSAGVRKGIVINPDKLAEIISSSVSKAQDDCGQRIREVYANVGGSHIFCGASHGLVSVSRADQKISEEDIARVLQAAQTFPLPSNKEILDIFPKDFIVDSEKGIKDPLGMQGVRLEVDAMVVGGFSPYLRNSNQALLNSGLQVLDLTPSPLAIARAVLTPMEKELGVLLMDIGAQTTNVCVLEEENLVHLSVFPVGSGNITNDIAICLKVDIDTAEKIKIQFGTCLLSQNKKIQKRRQKPARSCYNVAGGKEQFKIEGLSPEEAIVFDNKMLTKIIEARMFEIFKEVQKELKKIGKAGLLPGGVVLTGGGSKLPKIKDFCKKELKLPCRIGLPKGFFPEIDDPSFALAAGLVLEGIDSGEEKSSLSGKGILGKIKRAFKVFIP